MPCTGLPCLALSCPDWSRYRLLCLFSSDLTSKLTLTGLNPHKSFQAENTQIWVMSQISPLC